MTVERWNPKRHLDLLGSWLAKREQATSAGDARLYPSTGFVVDRCAIGFLYCTDAPHVGYIDGIVTDPAVPTRRRHAALTQLCASIVEAADEKGIRLLFGSTNFRGLSRISERHGFRTYGEGFRMIVRANPRQS